MSQNKQNSDVSALLEEQRRPWYVKAAAAAVLGALCIGGWYWYSGSNNKNTATYVTKQVTRGPISVTVMADGTLNPVRTVTLGSELSGIVREVTVDVNDSVKVGETLIRLDQKNPTARVSQSRAAVESAQAKHKQAQAQQKESELKLKRMQELNRLSKGQMPSRTELESQQASVEAAKAATAVAAAAIEDAKASLATAENDLAKTNICSPIDGVVLARSVEPGYAVAASLQAVELLRLATDLSELELQVSVDEADIGVVQKGQPAYFTVSAYPNRRFPAELTKVAYGSNTAENVVTYTTYLSVDNKQMMLRPGMTATATISTNHKDSALRVPNTAFRFQPVQDKASGGITGMMTPPGPHSGGTKVVKEEVRHGETEKTLYVLRGGQPERVTVKTGLTDGVVTEIVSGALSEGDQVIIEQRTGKAR